MEEVQELHAEYAAEPRRGDGARVQAGTYFLELSLDWIVLRASENIHHLLGESHVTLIDEPLGRFAHSQALHDLRNNFSRLSGTTGIGRAYGVRLTNEPELVDIAFQLSDRRILFEAVSSSLPFGGNFGSVGGLVAGLADNRGQALLDGGARRMRALTGYDRVTLVCGEERVESSRGAFSGPADMSSQLPAIIADVQAEGVGLFPRDDDQVAIGDALMSSPDGAAIDALVASGVRSSLRAPFVCEAGAGEFRCESRRPCEPSLELHAAAELFAQLFALRLEIDQLKS
jgi:light-regulated signal transduction histidine kinase (bacteriophytochrome)